MKPKHLVLHPDVHQKLKKRKSVTGEAIQEIGNSILRAALYRPLLTEVIARKLLSARKLTNAEWEDVLGAALEEAQSAFPSFSDQILVTDRTRVGEGSWRRCNIYRPPNLAFEVVEHEAHNLDEDKQVAHVHDGQEFLIVLAGTVQVHIQDEAVTLRAGDSLHFNGKDPHLTLPVDEAARVLSINIPAWSDSAAKLVERQTGSKPHKAQAKPPYRWRTVNGLGTSEAQEGDSDPRTQVEKPSETGA